MLSESFVENDSKGKKYFEINIKKCNWFTLNNSYYNRREPEYRE